VACLALRVKAGGIGKFFCIVLCGLRISYILKSTVASKYYTGKTDNLESRLLEHNSRKHRYTARYSPWKIIYFEQFTTEPEAIIREKYFKSAAGGRWLKKM